MQWNWHGRILNKKGEIMTEDTITVPEHYKLLVKEIKPLIKEIQDAFINRPAPSGYNYQGLDEAVERLKRLERPIKNITAAFNDISHILEDKTVSSEKIRYLISQLRLPIGEVISYFHEIWKRPFKPEIANGQAILSAIPERILRECLTAFEQATDVVEKPEEMVKKHGKQKFYINIVFGDEEINHFLQWIKGHPSYQVKLQKSDWWTAAAIGFLFGYWIGDD